MRKQFNYCSVLQTFSLIKSRSGTRLVCPWVDSWWGYSADLIVCALDLIILSRKVCLIPKYQHTKGRNLHFMVHSQVQTGPCGYTQPWDNTQVCQHSRELLQSAPNLWGNILHIKGTLVLPQFRISPPLVRDCWWFSPVIHFSVSVRELWPFPWQYSRVFSQTCWSTSGFRVTPNQRTIPGEKTWEELHQEAKQC